jgi:hypothetical protein
MAKSSLAATEDPATSFYENHRISVEHYTLQPCDLVFPTPFASHLPREAAPSSGSASASSSTSSKPASCPRQQPKAAACVGAPAPPVINVAAAARPAKPAVQRDWRVDCEALQGRRIRREPQRESGLLSVMHSMMRAMFGGYCSTRQPQQLSRDVRLPLVAVA